MTSLEKRLTLESPTIAYISALGGFEIKRIAYGIEDYVFAVSGAWCSEKQAHLVRIQYTRDGRSFIRVCGTRLYLDEAIRC